MMKLILEDGEVFQCTPFGAMEETCGEIVFNTGMTGYVESLTDPSYQGQILVLTYPLQGNYGVPAGSYESNRIQIRGLVVGHYSHQPSHHSSVKTLGSWLQSEGIPGVQGVDVRTLTRILRERGTTTGVIRFESSTNSFDFPEMSTVLERVVQNEVIHYSGGDLKILLIDTGVKESIISSLLKRGATVVRAAWNSKWENYLRGVNGVLLTNGPGDPMNAGMLIHQVRQLFNACLPIFGICFGHQLLSLAAGAKTCKMRYGHRSVNQPVQDLFTKRCYITSQNHGYVVERESLPVDWEPWFVNLNDGTNEGIRHSHKPISSVQFHPEASPGPKDTAFLFDHFLSQVSQCKSTYRKSDLLCQL